MGNKTAANGYKTCPVCEDSISLKVSGTLRRHPKFAPPGEQCAGSDRAPIEADQATKEIVAGDRRVFTSKEPMLGGPAVRPPCPAGKRILMLLAYVDADGHPADQAAALFEDPDVLYKTLSAVANKDLRVALKVVD